MRLLVELYFRGVAGRERDEWLSVGRAARLIGVHPATLRRWEAAGRLSSRRVNERGDRRYSRESVLALAGPVLEVREALYVRVSGSGDQLSSLKSQEAELRCTAVGEVVGVYSDVASGLSERRRGLQRLLRDAATGAFTVVRVTHGDRLTRFGLGYLEDLLAVHGVAVEVLHEREQSSPDQELVDDFISLLASFSGRLYGQRSAAAKRRLLDRAGDAGQVSA
jgi:predicted site-specific integrase-resolvase